MNQLFFQIKGKDSTMPGEMMMMGVGTQADQDYGENVSLAGTLSGKSDFDRRKKKRWLLMIFFLY